MSNLFYAIYAKDPENNTDVDEFFCVNSTSKFIYSWAFNIWNSCTFFETVADLKRVAPKLKKIKATDLPSEAQQQLDKLRYMDTALRVLYSKHN